MSANTRFFAMMGGANSTTYNLISGTSNVLIASGSSWSSVIGTPTADRVQSREMIHWDAENFSGTYVCVRGVVFVNFTLTNTVASAKLVLTRENAFPSIEDAYLCLYTGTTTVTVANFGSFSTTITGRSTGDATKMTFEFNAAGLALLNDGRTTLGMMVKNWRDEENTAPTVPQDSDNVLFSGSYLEVSY